MTDETVILKERICFTINCVLIDCLFITLRRVLLGFNSSSNYDANPPEDRIDL